MRIIFICFMLAVGFAHAQDPPEVDSLKKELIGAIGDTNKVNNYAALGYYYQWSNPDSALTYALPGLALAMKLEYKIGEYDMLLPVSEALSKRGNFSKALEFRFRSLELAKEMKDAKKIGNSLALLGNTYLYSKDYHNALKYLYEAKATNAVGLGGPQFLYAFIGEAYFHLENFDSATFYIQKAYDIDKKDSNLHWSVPYQYLAAIYEKKGNLSRAIDLYRESLPACIFTSDFLQYCTGIASVFKKAGQQDSAIFYSMKAIEEGTAVSMPEHVIEASTLLASIYRSLNNADSVMKYQDILIAAKDSLFSQDKVRQIQNVTYEQQLRQQEIEKQKKLYENKIKEYAFISALAILIIIGFILWRNNKHKQKANTILHQQKEKVETTLSELRSTQAQLIQSEKMASLGELTAGIAHEIQNPLNFVNNFSDVNAELLEELKAEANKGNIEEVKAIADDVINNEQKINHHGKRADAIVKGMLQHSQKSSGQKEPTNINKLADEYLRLSYQGFRAKDKSLPTGQSGFNATLNTNFDESIEKINIIPQDIGRVLLNLYNNAFYAVNEKKLAVNQEGFKNLLGLNYEPTVSISTKKLNDKVQIIVKDNGNGIPQKIIDKIFQPFFTTKPTGQGTGLGLSLAYDIVKAHGGEIKVESREGQGSEFIIQLPIN